MAETDNGGDIHRDGAVAAKLGPWPGVNPHLKNAAIMPMCVLRETYRGTP